MKTPRNQKSLSWHVEANDYFGTLATVLDLLKQRMERQGYSRKDGALLADIRDELMVLQADFLIVRREERVPGG